MPGLAEQLGHQITKVMRLLRGLSRQKAPEVAESFEGAKAHMSLRRVHFHALALE